MKKNIRVLTAALLLAVMLTTNAGIADIYAEDSGNTGASGMQDEITSVDPTKDAAGENQDNEEAVENKESAGGSQSDQPVETEKSSDDKNPDATAEEKNTEKEVAASDKQGEVKAGVKTEKSNGSETEIVYKPQVKLNNDPLADVRSDKQLNGDKSATYKTYKDGDTISYTSKAGDWTVFNADGHGYSNGWCIQTGVVPKESGKATVKKLSNTSLTAKVAYYYGEKKGYNTNDGYYMSDAKWPYKSAFACMLQYSNEGKSAITYLERFIPSYCLDHMKEDVDDLKEKTVNIPDEFEAYKCDAGDGQDFMFWQMTEGGGTARILKTSSIADLPTRDPTNYSLKGAVYYLYTDAGCTSRAVDIDGNKVAFTVNDNTGKSNAAEVKPGTYWVKEVTAPPGYNLDTAAHQVTVEKGSEKTVTLTDTPKYAEAYLEKSPEKTQVDYIKEAPVNYTLKGAVYEVFTDAACTKAAVDINGKAVVFTTDEKGRSGIVKITPGTYYAKEKTPSKGFLTDRNIATKPVTVSLSNTASNAAKFTSAEPPAFGYPSLTLIKVDEEGNYGWKKLKGTEYKMSYFAVDPGTKDVSGMTPKRTWTFRARKVEDSSGTLHAGIDLAADEPVEGDEFYTENGKRVMPAGVFTIEESKAAPGMALNPKKYYGKLWQPSAGAEIKVSFEENEDLSVSRPVTDKEQHPVIEIRKKDAETRQNIPQGADREFSKGSLAGAEYEVYFDDPLKPAPVKVGKIITDEAGTGSISQNENGEPLELGTYHIAEVKASPGYTLDAFYYKDVNDKSFVNGMHLITARAAALNTDSFKYAVESLEKPHHTVIHKTDITNGKELPGATLQVINQEGRIVEQWISGDKPHDIKALPDGTYTLREITAPEGYEVAEDAEFVVDGEHVKCEVTMADKPVRKPEISTKIGERDGSRVIDTVKYDNLISGNFYEVKGYFVRKKDGEKVKGSDGRNVFTADKPDGSIEVKLTPGEEKGDLVAYEYLYLVTWENGERKATLIAQHTDINSKAQTYRQRVTPKTGDNSLLYLYSAFLASALTALAAVIYRKRGRRIR